MTALTADPAVTTIEDLDHEWTVPCNTKPCTNPAVWIVWIGACCPEADNVLLWCPDCLDFCRRYTSLWCAFCGAGEFTGAQIIRKIEPLNPKETS